MHTFQRIKQTFLQIDIPILTHKFNENAIKRHCFPKNMEIRQKLNFCQNSPSVRQLNYNYLPFCARSQEKLLQVILLIEWRFFSPGHWVTKKSSIIRQKGESQNKKTKHAKFSEKRIFLTPRYVYVRVRIRR